MDDNHLTIGHRSGYTPQIFRSDGQLHPGHYNDFWNPFVGRPTLGAPNGVTVGDRAIQIGSHWRIAQMDVNHLVISHSNMQTPQIFGNDGRLHPGPRKYAWNAFNRALGEPSGVTSSEYYIQIGSFRIGVADFSHSGGLQAHLSVGYGSATSIGMTSMVYRSDGAVIPGPRTDAWNGAVGTAWNPWYI